MRRYLYYLWYVLRHKWFVFVACLELDIPWLGLIHDISKFWPDEFLPYARFFHNPNGSRRQVRNETGYYKPHDTGDPDFDLAWFLHQKRNKHHWQWYILPLDGGGLKILPIPDKHLREMLADWMGAGRAQGTPDTGKWYRENKDKLMLHPEARRWIEGSL